ncbi:MAG: hypothetical protein U0793_18950 [Gemmataceae bacterium]
MSKNAAYDQFIDGLLAEPQAFSPFAEYDPEGDCIEFFVKPGPYCAERIDGLLTIYRSQETGEIVGSLIKRVAQLCRELLGKYPNLRIEVQDGKIRLVHIIRAKLWLLPSGDPDIIHIYKVLADAADEAKAEVDATPCEAAG